MRVSLQRIGDRGRCRRLDRQREAAAQRESDQLVPASCVHACMLCVCVHVCVRACACVRVRARVYVCVHVRVNTCARSVQRSV